MNNAESYEASVKEGDTSLLGHLQQEFLAKQLDGGRSGVRVEQLVDLE